MIGFWGRPRADQRQGVKVVGPPGVDGPQVLNGKEPSRLLPPVTLVFYKTQPLYPPRPMKQGCGRATILPQLDECKWTTMERAGTDRLRVSW